MVFVLRTRETGRFASEAIADKATAERIFEEAWHDLRLSAEDWAIALYDVPDIDDPDAAIDAVRASGGVIVAHRDHRTDEAAMRDLRRIIGRP